MKSLVLKAEVKNLDRLLDFVNEEAEPAGFTMAEMMRIDLAVEEVFVNIASYAYGEKTGEAEVLCRAESEPACLTVVFKDSGIPFDPLMKEDADTSREATLSREGGLGIFLVKKNMDEISYAYENGQNVLTIKKYKMDR